MFLAAGFLVRQGQAHLWGFDPTALGALGQLQAAGRFFFQCILAFPQLVAGFTYPVWPGGHDLLLYLGLLLLFPAADAALRSPRSWLRKVVATRWLFGCHIAVLTLLFLYELIWIQVLATPLSFTNLLFPISAPDFPQQAHEYTKKTSWIADVDDPRARRDLTSEFLFQALASENLVQKNRGDLLLVKWQSYARWQQVEETAKGCALALVLMISAINGSILWALWLRFDRSPQRSPILARFSVAGALVIVLGFQACTIPFNFGILMTDQSVLQVEISSATQPDLENGPFLLLGQDRERLYLYSPERLWTVYGVRQSEITTMKILGKTHCLAWIQEIVPEL